MCQAAPSCYGGSSRPTVPYEVEYEKATWFLHKNPDAAKQQVIDFLLSKGLLGPNLKAHIQGLLDYARSIREGISARLASIKEEPEGAARRCGIHMVERQDAESKQLIELLAS